MKRIIQQLLDFIRLYPLWHWLVLLLFCSVSVWVNYGLGLQSAINKMNGRNEFLAYCALYGSHSLFAYILYSISSGNTKFWKQPGFIILLLLGLMVFSFRAITWQHVSIIHHFSEAGQKRINAFAFNNIFRLLYLVIPITGIWLIKDRKEMPLYGVSVKNHHWKLYWILLLCMLPLIVGASFLSDFLAYYPRFRNLYYMGASNWKVVSYEFFYGLDFTSIELFFRGFLVIAFIKYVGPHAILPMAAFYLSIHYGKPMGEAISSFFGGCILGVISFHSRSILGGIMVHVGIAWLMELGAWIGNLVNGNW